MKKIGKRLFAFMLAGIICALFFPKPAFAFASSPKAGDYVDPVDYYGLGERAGYQLTAQSDIRDAILAKDLVPVELVLKPLYIETSAIRLAHGNSDDFSPLEDYTIYQGEPWVIKCNEKSSYTVAYEAGNSGRQGENDVVYNFQWQAKIDITFDDVIYYVKDNDWTGKSFKLDYGSAGSASSDASIQFVEQEGRDRSFRCKYDFGSNAENEGIKWYVDKTGILKVWVETTTVPGGVFEEWRAEYTDEVLRESMENLPATIYFQIEKVKLGKIEGIKGASGLLGTRDSGGSDDDDMAGPLSTIAISILAILISILFGNTGGFIPATPVSAGGGPPPPVPAGDGLSRWLRFDGDGDIEATDPVNGQRRTFVKNGDGTYTDPVSAATYTPEELSEQMEHRADNAGTIRQDEAQFEQNVREDRQRNQERSDESSQLEKDLLRERQERSEKEKIERIATDLGMSGASKKEVEAELKSRMERDEAYRQKMHDYAKQRDTAVDILEATVEIADYTMAAGEAVVPGGKAVSATYKGIKNTVSTMAEKGASWGSFTEGAIKGGTEAATTMMKGGIGKAGVAFGGTVAGEVADAVNDGGDLTDALVKGTVKGTFNAASGAVGDAYGDAVGGTYGEMLGKDSTIKKVAETVGKLGEVGFEKNVTGTIGDNLNGENK